MAITGGFWVAAGDRSELRQLALAMMQSLYAKAGERLPEKPMLLVDAWLAFSTGVGLYYIAEPHSKSREALRKTVVIPWFLELLAKADLL